MDYGTWYSSHYVVRTVSDKGVNIPLIMLSSVKRYAIDLDINAITTIIFRLNTCSFFPKGPHVS